MLTVFCFKWSPRGERRIPSQDIVEYGADHVNRLYSSLSRNLTVPFVLSCITDRRDPDISRSVKQIDLWNEFGDLGGCYPRLKMYDDSEHFMEYLGLSHRFNRFMCIDLDVVITGNIDHVVKRTEDFVYYRMPGPDGTGIRFNCGMFMMNYGARPWVYHKFRQNPKFWIYHPVIQETPGSDQAWCNHCLDLYREARWDKSDGIYDARQDLIEKGVTRLPDDCRMVMWPGPRDPSESRWRNVFPWIEEHWK